MKMIIIKENCINEANFRWKTVKNFQVSGTKAKITIEVDIANAIKNIATYDASRYRITQDQLNPAYLAEVIAHQLDWQAYALSTNDDHELSTILADLNG
jgi:nicotinate-nucleotide pyrophosphorylase